LNVLDLFSGIGGFSLGLERAGMRTVAFCEIEEYPRAVLARHWPTVPRYDDVRNLTADRLRTDGIVPDLICGGFPFQDASVAQTGGPIQKRRDGIDGERTGLFIHIKRLAADFPRAILVLENVPGLLSAGFGSVLGHLAEIGRDAEWRCVPALAAGLPHRRDRLWIVAYPSGSRLSRSIEGRSLLECAETALPIIGHEAAGAWRSLDGNWDSIRAGDGVSVAMERRRVKPCGNAIIPQMSEAIGRAIVKFNSTSHP
jgi:DNA (cytosine-5)-methyltransferase 1